jgi:CRP-like cAMP-binding protein
VEERCGRWLLMCHDQADGDRFPITQEFLSVMLGVRRPTVTLVLGMIQEAGFIRNSRGHVTITDREGLEESSCECYQIIRESMPIKP